MEILLPLIPVITIITTLLTRIPQIPFANSSNAKRTALLVSIVAISVMAYRKDQLNAESIDLILANGVFVTGLAIGLYESAKSVYEWVANRI